MIILLLVGFLNSLTLQKKKKKKKKKNKNHYPSIGKLYGWSFVYK